MTWKCTTCDQEFSDGIPKDAVQLTSERHRVSSYRFSDGTVHHLRRALGPSANHRWHKSPRPDCVFCFPPPKQAEKLPDLEQPVVEQSREVQVPETLPEIIIEEVKPAVMAEFECELTTALAIAFRRRKQIQN